MLDLVLQGGLVVNADRAIRADVGIREGRIAVLAAPGHTLTGRRVIDCGDKWLLPGLIDPHVHFNFGNPERDFATETRSAALGGITCALSFFRTADFLAGLEPELARSSSQSVIDYSYHLGLTSHAQVGQLAACYERYGISSHKMYLMYKGVAGQAKGFTEIDDSLLYAALRETARLPGAVMGVHCENVEVVPLLRGELRMAGRTDLAAWDEQSPDFLEAENINRVCYFAARAGCPVNIVHLSSREGLEEIRRHRARSKVPIHLETCPHYLFLRRDAAAGVLAKVNPPLRSDSDVDALWEAVLDGTVSTIGSDHVARKRATKGNDLWSASAGFPGVATMLPILMHEGVHRRGLRPERLVALTSANVARNYNIAGKGAIAPGFDADIAIVDPDLECTVGFARHESFSDYSVYEGMKLRGWPIATIARGRLLAENGALTAEAVEGSGRFITRKAGTHRQ